MLILIRRLFAIVLVPLAFALLLGGLVACRVNATVLSAAFYTDTLDRLDVYNFLYDEAIPLAIDEASKRGDLDLGDVPLGITLTPQRIAGYAERVAPPEWLQAQVEQAISQAVPYVTGETDTVRITVRLDDRVEVAAAVARELVKEGDAYGYLMRELVTPAVEDVNLGTLPFGLSLTTDKAVAGIREVVPKDWFDARVDQALDAAVPYVTGKTDAFAITVPLRDRSDAALAVLRRWLQDGLAGPTYDYLLKEQITPTLRVALGGAVQLPFGITLSNAEIESAVAAVLPRAWLSARVDDAFAALGPYLRGDTNSFTITIPLRERLQQAAPALAQIADTKLRTTFEALPVCTLTQLLTVDLAKLTTTLPPCRPPGVSYAQLKTVANIDLAKLVETTVVAAAPVSVNLTSAELLRVLPAGVNVERLRGYLRDGYTFTDKDLRRIMQERSGADAVQRVDDVRRYLRDGITITEQDIRAAIDDAGADSSDVDQVRRWIGLARSLSWVPLALALALSVAIGFLGGRGWGGRLAWAGVPLLIGGAITAAAVVVATGPVNDAINDEVIQQLRDNDVPGVVIVKALEARDLLVGALLGAVRTWGIVFAALGLVMLGAGIVLGRSRPAPVTTPS